MLHDSKKKQKNKLGEFLQHQTSLFAYLSAVLWVNVKKQRGRLTGFATPPANETVRAHEYNEEFNEQTGALIRAAQKGPGLLFFIYFTFTFTELLVLGCI